MEKQKPNPIRARGFSEAGAAKLREMSQNPQLYADFLKFHGRVFKHEAYVSLEFFVQNPEASFIATQKQWEMTNRSIAQNARSVQFADDQGSIRDYYDFSQTTSDMPPHLWTVHLRNSAQIKEALGILETENVDLISGVILSTLTPDYIAETMKHLNVPLLYFQKHTRSILTTVQCIMAGRLEIGGSHFEVTPDSTLFNELQTESEKLGFLSFAAKVARDALLKIEKAALEWEAAERMEQYGEDQLPEIHGNDRGGMGADTGRSSAGSAEGTASQQDRTLESGAPRRKDGLPVNTGGEERTEHALDAGVQDGYSERGADGAVQTRSDNGTVSAEDGERTLAGGTADREIRHGVDGVHGGALSGGNDMAEISAPMADGSTVGGEIGNELPGASGSTVREGESTSGDEQLRGASGVSQDDGLLRGQHSDEGESLSSGDESLTAKLNSVFSAENNETSTDSADVFILDEDMADLSDEEQLVQLALEIKQGEDLVTELMRDRNYVEASRIALELDEMTRKADALKAEIQKQAITEEDVQALRSIQPPRKSVQNLLEHEVAQTPKFEALLHSEMGEKSAYEMRKSDNSWREDESKTVPVTTVMTRQLPSKISELRKGENVKGINRGTFVNEDTKFDVIFARKAIDETISKAIQDDKRGKLFMVK